MTRSTAVRALTDGGVDVSFEATGNAAVVAPGGRDASPAAGPRVAIGVPAPDSTVTLDWGELTERGGLPDTRRRLKITDGGDPTSPRTSRRGWMAAVDGRLDLGALVTVEAPVHRRTRRPRRSARCSPARSIRTVIRFD